jgi:hypothetical protein
MNASLQEPARTFKVLSLDGGGMRGLYTATLLEHLALKFDDDRANYPRELDVGLGFDLIVGTSTGGILACALAVGYPPKRIVEFYKSFGPRIFKNLIPRREWGLSKFALGHLSKPANDGAARRAGLVEIFGSMTIGQVYKDRGIRLCLPTVDMARHAPLVIKTGHLEGKHRDDGVTLVDACLATSAAPIVLPLAQITIDGAMRTTTDGGLWANSPIMLGLIEALNACGDCDIEVLSIGTCPPPVGSFAAKGATNRGLLGWRFGVGIVETSLDVQSSAAGFAFDQLRSHLRVKASLARFRQTTPSAQHQRLIGIDRADDDAIHALQELATGDAEQAHSDIMGPDRKFPFVRDIFTTLPDSKPVVVP